MILFFGRPGGLRWAPLRYGSFPRKERAEEEPSPLHPWRTISQNESEFANYGYPAPGIEAKILLLFFCKRL
jgi:hypothetical protein